jgi:hypothetical protein
LKRTGVESLYEEKPVKTVKKYTSPYKPLKTASPVKAPERAAVSPTKTVPQYTTSPSKISFRNHELEAATAKI